MKSFTTWLSLSNYPRSHPGEMLKALQIQLRCQKLMETYGLIACGILMYCRCPISECNHLRNSHVLTGTLLYFSNIQDVSQTPRGDNLWGQSSKGSFATLQPQNHQNPQIPKVQSTVFWWQNPYWTSILTVCFFFGWQPMRQSLSVYTISDHFTTTKKKQLGNMINDTRARDLIVKVMIQHDREAVKGLTQQSCCWFLCWIRYI